MMTHLAAGTNYEYRLTMNGTVGEILTFTTDTIMQVPNLGFDDWVMKTKRLGIRMQHWMMPTILGFRQRGGQHR